MSARDAAAARRGRNLPANAGGNNQPANRQPADPANTMRSLLDRMKPELATALPRHMTPDRMARQALTVFRTTPDLAECSPQSFLGALMTCAQVGLEPGPQGHVYIVPFWNSKARQKEATFILGYRGIVELARRSGELVDIAAHTVYANEVDQGRFKVTYGTSPSIDHDPIVFGERGEPVGYYAVAVLKSGGRPFVVLSKADVETFRVRSATQKAERASGPWNTDYEAMAWKTCVRRLERWLPQSPELAAAFAHEDTVRAHMPGEVVSSVLEQQPPAPEDADTGEPDDAQQQALEQQPTRPPAQQQPRRPEPEQAPAPQQQQQRQEAPPAAAEVAGGDPWGQDYPEPEVPDPNDGDDPWKD